MAAFDVTTKPTSLSLKPGSTGSIMVVVSNRLGKPVMGLVEGILTPASVAKWLVSPPPDQAQRRYEADPAATANLEFKVVVPKDAGAQDVQFMASARDVLSPDDTRVDGQMVAIKVIPDQPVVVDGGGKGIPWWVWLIVAVVVVGVGFGIYMVVRPKGVPNVVGMTEAKATAKLTKAGFTPVTPVDTLVVDTLAEQSEDTNIVVRQDPVAKSELPVDSMKGKTPATIVVNRSATEVPQIVNRPLALAIDRLRAAGLSVQGDPVGRYTANVAQDDQIADVNPDEGTRVPRGSGVTLVIYSYSERPPVICPDIRKCVVEIEPGWNPQIERARTFLRDQ